MIPATKKLRILSLFRQGYLPTEVAAFVGIDWKKCRRFVRTYLKRRAEREAMKAQCERLQWQWRGEPEEAAERHS